MNMADIDDPFRPRDSVVRPRPGAGRRGSTDATVALPAAPPQAGEAEPLPAAAQELLGAGLNPLVRAATPLLLLAGRLRGTLTGPAVASVRQFALDEIRQFEQRAQSAGIANEVVLAARYALAATLDEAVLSTPWGAQSEWAQQTLLVVLHREAWGGEKFFDMLERTSQDPARHIDLLELQYLCIAVGFCGKYQVLDRGHAGLAQVQRDLYQKIRQQRGAPDSALSLRWQGLQDRRNPVIRYVPWWVVGAAALAVLAGTFVFYSTALGRSAAPIEAELGKVGLEGFAAPPASPVVIQGVTLKQLLASDEAAGALSVEEQNGRTVVTLLGSGLFASGSATTNPAFDPLLQRVAGALSRVHGRVLVVGHTDDQPLRSLRYADNFELSRERALNVVKVLQRGTDTAGRIQWTGAGSSQPRYQPASDPENRARNRRVEIIHISGL
jgi:type VI secretion system protein ImpK